MNGELIRRVLWPERGPLFLIIGGIVSMVSDFASFLGNLASPQVLLWPAAGLAALLAWFCISRVFAAKKNAPAAPADEGGDAHGDPAIAATTCRECDVFRILLFATIGIITLVIAGQGATATERIGAQLGLIQQDVAAIREDTSAIRDVTSSGELVRNPRTAEDYFRNAWIYQMMRRDADQAWASMQDLYRRHAPNKLDAAELYLNTGRAHLSRDALLAEMVRIGRERRDASMLVIAARNTLDFAQAQPLYAEARALDADLPFAYWDVARTDLLNLPGPGSSAEVTLERIRVIIAGMDQFREVASRKPLASYFYLPQYQADYEAMARTMAQTYRGHEETWLSIQRQQQQLEQMRRR